VEESDESGRPRPARARDEAPPVAHSPAAGLGEPPACVPEDDFDADAEMARWVADIEAGRERIPEEWELDGSAVSLSLGDARDLDPELLAAILGPDGLGGQSLAPVFGQDQAADALRPGPVLAALTEQAASDLGALTDNELTGVLQAARRLASWAAYLLTIAIAEYGRRRFAQLADAKAARIPKGCRPGDFLADELASELVTSAHNAETRIEQDVAITTRLPQVLAGMAAGRIDADRAATIAAWTASLTDADAAQADEILAAAAPRLRWDQLARKAAALELKLNPDGVKARKEHAKATRQRVEVRREDSGNSCLAGRELDATDALASKAYIDALAVRIRNYGHADQPLSNIRARVFTELTQGRNPLDLLKPRPKPRPRPADATDPAGLRDPDDPGPDYPGPDYPGPDYPGDFSDPEDLDDYDDPGPDYAGPDGAPSWTDDEAESVRYIDPDDPAERRGPLRPGQSAPPPANLNLIIPIGTLVGWSTTPAQAGGFGLLDPDETRALTAAASRHPRTRWSVTLVDPQGHAIAHGRARGQHPWEPPPHETPPAPPPEASPPTRGAPMPTADQAAQLAKLNQALAVIFDPIAQDTCDHAGAENRYTPGRRLKDLVRARTQICDAPGCNAQAIYGDLDHTTPYPDGPTCQCNLGPKCRRHHRAKQAPGWHVEQPEPGIIDWTLPNGRTHTTTPTAYDS
jgi:Domain of unknown function (DUF222)